MFGRFNRFNTTGSNGNGYESASRCASFNFILLVIDAVLAVSIFVCAEILGLAVSVLLGAQAHSCVFLQAQGFHVPVEVCADMEGIRKTTAKMRSSITHD